jgi:hypothetical protein
MFTKIRGDIRSFVFIAVINDTGDNLSPITTTPAINLSPVSTTPVIKLVHLEMKRFEKLIHTAAQ